MANTAMRPTRADEERLQRRRRDDGTLDRINRLTLHIPEEIEAKYGSIHKFRWTNDEGNRIHAKTQLDDWDVVDEVPPIPVGTDASGRPIKAHLCRKLKEFCDEDLKKRQDELLEMEKGLIQGNREANTALPDTAYVAGRNSITRGQSKG